MNIEIHTLSWLPVSCINRDDAGQPKTCNINGVPRARWSSQSQKHVLRQKFNKVFEAKNMSVRTKHLPTMLKNALMEQGLDDAAADNMVKAFAATLDIKLDKKEDSESAPKTKVMWALPQNVDAAAAFLTEHAYAFDPEAEAPEDAPYKRAALKTGKDKDGNTTLITDNKAKKAIIDLAVSAEGLVDVALFGRMLAGVSTSTDASCSVMHAYTTHPDDYVNDYYTAVDDIVADQGSGHIGDQGYTSGVYYRYGCVSTDELSESGLLDEDLARQAVVEFVRQFALLQPKAKRFSTAPYTLPAMVMVKVSDEQPTCSDAFSSAVDSDDLISGSISAFSKRYEEIAKAYGSDDRVKGAFVLLPGDDEFTGMVTQVESFEALMGAVEAVL